jgi:radical SAM-linked protein
VILRLRSTKIGKIRFVGHRDMGRVWERALRRCGAPVAFTSGFTPRPRISFGLALPMGAESMAEYVDVEMDPQFGDLPDPAQIVPELSSYMPEGVDVTGHTVVDRSAPSLQEVVTSCTWELWGPDIDADRIDEACALAQESVLHVERERKGVRRTDDVRPLILDLRPSPDEARLIAELATAGRALRPAELAGLVFAGCDPLDVRVLRTHQWVDHNQLVAGAPDDSRPTSLFNPSYPSTSMSDSRREVISLPVAVPASAQGVGA